MFEDKELYGKIQYFFVHKYLEEYRMLAYIQWTSDIYIDRYHKTIMKRRNNGTMEKFIKCKFYLYGSK